MIATPTWGAVFYVLCHAAVILRVLSVDQREPTSRAAWVMILVFVPFVGIAAYLLFGEPWVARSFRRRAHAVAGELIAANAAAPGHEPELEPIPERFRSAFRVCERLGACTAVAGNRATLAADSNAAIDGMVRDFDAARETIHVSFYIWLTDNNGLKIVEALKRAAARGVTCRVVADGIGSRAMIGSKHWKAMAGAGVRLCSSLKLSHGLALVFGPRADLRNHRKIVVIDSRVTWCGSQNCADPEFRIKPRFAPWVDVMVRFEGPIAAQNQQVFVTAWMVETGENLAAMLRTDAAEDALPARGGFVAVAFGTGPMNLRGAMSDVFVSLLYGAHTEVVVSTPYFVPDPPLMAALVSCARRRVATTLILPARNDSLAVAAISRAQYPVLIDAGLRIHEYQGGLLHAKTLVADGEVALVGSANMDRRSLELNFENNILLHSAEVASALRVRQNSYLIRSREVTAESVRRRGFLRQLIGNTATMFGPVL
ncbi:MAG TPA: cardiolipin synthase [Nevskiaceae bacterium]